MDLSVNILKQVCQMIPQVALFILVILAPALIICGIRFIVRRIFEMFL